MNKTATFETTYTRYPFAPLVTLGLVIAAWLNGAAKKAGKTDSAKCTGSVPGPVARAA